MSFFTSRWIEVPDNLHERAGGLPQGFRAADDIHQLRGDRGLTHLVRRQSQ